MSLKSVPLLLEDIWESVEKIERYVRGLNHDTFVKDDKTVDSVVRNLEIIGEAAHRLPQDFKTRHSDIEWPKVIGLGHRIVHDYFNIDVEIVWEIIQNDLPLFKSKVDTDLDPGHIQFSTRRPRTRLNSLTLLVARRTLRLSAWATISKSIGPITRPTFSRPALISP